MKQHLHGGLPESIDVDALKKEVAELRQKNSDLESQVAQLQAEVRCHPYVIVVIIAFQFSLSLPGPPNSIACQNRGIVRGKLKILH